MDERREMALRDEGLKFMGKIVAVQTHEVTNAFSVINEMAGLEWDILRDSSAENPIDLVELESICGKIREHVDRGKRVVRSINWIAHSVDQMAAVIEIGETLKKIAPVAEYWKRRRRASFSLSLPDDSVFVHVRPFFFAFAVLLAVDLLTGRGGRQTIFIGGAPEKDHVELTIANLDQERLSPDASKLDMLTSLLIAFDAELCHPKNAVLSAFDRIVIQVPIYIPPSEPGVDAKEAQ